MAIHDYAEAAGASRSLTPDSAAYIASWLRQNGLPWETRANWSVDDDRLHTDRTTQIPFRFKIRQY